MIYTIKTHHLSEGTLEHRPITTLCSNRRWQSQRLLEAPVVLDCSGEKPGFLPFHTTLMLWLQISPLKYL